ncbi:MAG: bifunctional UDP-sugar hydrolase/5'-nucleotidase [Myxococcota bacterium]|nr:bifunctional UDP-sugar hydrolase/5'-nucleotidase [Myxococcota bacterium]
MMLFWSLVVACAHKPPVDVVDDSGENRLVVLHTNDLHGHFLPERAPWIDGEPQIGGFALLDAKVQAIREEVGDSHVLLLDGGDILTGTPLTDIEVRGSRGGAMLEFMELVGYDAWVLGNHEFDKGFSNTAELVKSSKIPVLSSNLDGVEGGVAMEGLQDAIVLEKGGLKVGVIGATTMGLGHLASTSTMAKMKLSPLTQTVSEQLERLDPVTDLIVVLSHIGLEADRRLAEEVSGIDLIVGGHSHTYLPEPEQVNGTWIVQAGSYGRSIGRVEIGVNQDEITDFEGQLVDLLPSPDAEVRPQMRDLVSHYEEIISSEFGQVIAEAEQTLSRSYYFESDLGNWITDVLREAGDTDVAFYNVGGLRADLVGGEVTTGSIYEIFPFGNQVVTFEISASELLGVMLSNAKVALEQNHGSIQQSGVEMTWRERMDTPEAVSIRVGGAPFDPDATYTVTSNSYVAEQANRYLAGAQPANLVGLEATVFDVAVAAAKTGTIQKPIDGRLRKVE